MTYEFARDTHHRGLTPIEAANEYLRLFAEDAGLAAGFRVGLHRHSSARHFVEFRRFLKIMEGR